MPRARRDGPHGKRTRDLKRSIHWPTACSPPTRINSARPAPSPVPPPETLPSDSLDVGCRYLLLWVLTSVPAARPQSALKPGAHAHAHFVASRCHRGAHPGFLLLLLPPSLPERSTSATRERHCRPQLASQLERRQMDASARGLQRHVRARRPVLRLDLCDELGPRVLNEGLCRGKGGVSLSILLA